LEIGRRLKPDFVEILPSACYELIDEIKNELHANVLMGGLIRTKEEVMRCFEYGAIAVTASDPKLWELN
jgi:glycerol uptake operon antiterminator